MRAVCVIPARGGSKRLPRKNVIEFLGRPIIAYSIDAAAESGVFSRVVVSTEDEEIAEIGWIPSKFRFHFQYNVILVQLCEHRGYLTLSVGIVKGLIDRGRRYAKSGSGITIDNQTGL